jgi:myo-inositol-1(or 4)-monophosphatase
MKELLATAMALAEDAGKYIRESASRLGEVGYKGRADLVTDVDRKAEEIILAGIKKAYPDHAVLAEESGENLARSDFRWVVDPIDGTTNFVHGYPFFCVSIAVQHHLETVAAVVLNPMAGELFSTTTELSKALVATGFPYRLGELWQHSMRLFEAFYLNSHGVRRDGSAALDLCYVAAGRFDGFWEYELQPWDVAAGLLIVREAGGMVTDFREQSSGIADRQVLASNGRIHGEMLGIIKSQVQGL